MRSHYSKGEPPLFKVRNSHTGGEVVVAVQCADGTRVQATFHSNTSLLEVLSQLKLDCSPHGMEPSLVCLREEVSNQSRGSPINFTSVSIPTTELPNKQCVGGSSLA